MSDPIETIDVPPDAPPAIVTWVAADRRQQTSAMRAQLAPGVHLVSPLTDGFAFDGPDEVMAVFESAFELLRDIRIVGVTGTGRDWVVHGTNTLGGRNLEEIQWLHLDAGGLIDRIDLFIRPAPAAVSLLASIGPPLHRRGVLLPSAVHASRLAAPAAAALRLAESRLMPRLRRTPGA